MTAREYLLVLRKRWLTVFVGLVLGITAALAVVVVSPKVYQAEASEFVSITLGGPDQASALGGASQFALNRMSSYVDTVRSPTVLQPVIDNLGLHTSVKLLARKVSAENPVNTVLLHVHVVDQDPAVAARIANAVAAELADYIEEIEKPAEGGPSPVKATVYKPSQVPSYPISPRTKIDLALGALLGLAVGVLVAVFREQADTTVKSADDLQAITGTSPLGVVQFDPDTPRRPLVIGDDTGARAEAFRTIRTNLQFVDVDRRPKAVVITSALAHEGKTTTACNLAITMAQSGNRVCLIEADLRRAKVTEYLGIEGAAVGLSNVLAGQRALDDVLIAWNRGLLTVLPAGTCPPDPSELLGSHGMVAMLDDLRQRFDTVVLDAPPLLPVTDAAVISRFADGVILVARYGHTTRDKVSRAMAALDTAGARVLGTVLTFEPAQKGAAYGYGYGYGPRAEQRDAKTAGGSTAANVATVAAGPRPGTAASGKHSSRGGVRTGSGPPPPEPAVESAVEEPGWHTAPGADDRAGAGSTAGRSAPVASVTPVAPPAPEPTARDGGWRAGFGAGGGSGSANPSTIPADAAEVHAEIGRDADGGTGWGR